jgi:hypothetical protein
MSRIETINNLFANLSPVRLTDLDMAAQVAVIYRAARSANNNVVYWEERAATDRDPTYAEKNAAMYREMLPGMYEFLDRAAHYVEAGNREMAFDTGYVDESGNLSGDVEYSVVAVADHPHSWAKRNLVEEGMWDPDYTKGTTLQIPDVARIADRIAGQLAGRVILALANPNSPEWVPTEKDGKDLTIAALSPAALEISKASDRARATYRLALKHPPFSKSGELQGAAVAEAFRELPELDQEDDLKARIRRSTRIAGIVAREAKLARARDEAEAKLRAAGLSDEEVETHLADIFGDNSFSVVRAAPLAWTVRPIFFLLSNHKEAPPYNKAVFATTACRL